MQLQKDFLAGKISADAIEELGAGALRNAVVDGDVTNGSVMAGQIAGLVSKEESCEDILKDIYYGAAKVIREESKPLGFSLENRMTKTAFSFCRSRVSDSGDGSRPLRILPDS